MWKRVKKNWNYPRRVGIDEFALRKGHRNYDTVVSDIENGKPLEIIEGRDSERLIEVLSEQDIEMRERVEEVSVDMWEGFTKVIEKVFPNARIVYDRFHVMQQVNRELDHLRRQLKVVGKKLKYLILKNGEELKDEDKKDLLEVWKEHPVLQIAYEIKEEFRKIYEKQQTPRGGQREIEKWLRCARIIYRESALTIANHLEGICNYFTHRTTNAVAEGINTKIKLIKRQGYGFHNFANFRLRIFAAFDD